jgi:cell division protease FtsH
MQSRKVMNDHEKRVIAYHEAGHALCGELLPSQDKTHRISIIPRGHALGYTLHLPDEDRYLKSKDEMIDRMVVLLGGRVAEHIVFNAITTGASNDLQRVYDISRAMVAEYGMGTHLGSRRLPGDDYSVSDATRRMVDEEQQELTDLAWRRARKLIEDNRAALEDIAAELLAHEVLERETIEAIMARHGGGGGDVSQLPTGSETKVAAAERLDS